MLLSMIIIWCIFNTALYLFSCFIDPLIAFTNQYYKFAFYIEFYFNNLLWTLSVFFMVYCIKFKRGYNITKTLFDGGKRAKSISIVENGTKKRYASIDPDDLNGYDRDAPPPPSDHDGNHQYRAQKALNIDDVDLGIVPNQKNKSKQNHQGAYEEELKYEQEHEYSPRCKDKNEVISRSGTKSFTLTAETVYDNTKERQNQLFFIVSLYIIGFGSFLFNVIWYVMHPQYLEQFVFKEDWNMPRWYFPFDHHENKTVVIVKCTLNIFLI